MIAHRSGPRWVRHRCADCAYLGTSLGIDVYECFGGTIEPGFHTFTVRTGPLPQGGHAVLMPSGGWLFNPPHNVPTSRVRIAIEDVLRMLRS